MWIRQSKGNLSRNQETFLLKSIDLFVRKESIMVANKLSHPNKYLPIVANVLIFSCPDNSPRLFRDVVMTT